MRDLEYLLSRTNVDSYLPREPHLWLVSKIPRRPWDYCRSTSERKKRIHTYDDLVDQLIRLALKRKNDSHIEKFLKRHLGRGANPTPEPGEGKGSKSRTNTNKGGGKGESNLGAMSEVQPEAPEPRVFYCKPVENKRGPCHAHDCDHRSGCVLQLKRQQHTKDGKTVKHQDHLRCTITCENNGKRRYYEDECQIKKSESDKHKPQEAERQKAQRPTRAPQNEDEGGKGGVTGGGRSGTPNRKGRSSAPATSPSPDAAHPKKHPQGDNASPEGSNSTKRRQAWMAKSLMAAGVDV